MNLTISENQTWPVVRVFARLVLCWLLTLSGQAGISETEPNDSQPSANTLTFDANFRCSVSESKVYPRTDRDFFKVTVPQLSGPLSLRITMSPTASDQALDAWFRVLSPSGLALLSQDKASDNVPETYDLLVEGGSTYFIECRSADSWSSGAGNYQLSVNLFVPPTIQSVYWVTPNQTSTIFDGTPVQLTAKVAGFEVGETVTFGIYEDDALSDDFITSLTGKVVLVGTEKYVSATWNSQWISDGVGGPEFYFTVSGRGVSNTSTFLLNIIPADSDDSFGESIPFGLINTSREGNDTIELPDDVDIYSFQVVAGQTITFDIDRPSGSLAPLLRLFNSNGVELNKNAGGVGPLESPANEAFIQYTFPTTGNYYIGVSGVGNANYDPKNGNNDANGSTGAYRLTLSPGLVGHVRKQGGSTDYLVDFLRMDKPGQPIDTLKATWIIIHGWNDSRSSDSIKLLVNALMQSRPMDQVLTLDWSSIAISGRLAPGAAAAGIIPVGFWASETLKQAGFSGKQLNIIGHSFGSYVGDELAKFFPGKVNSIVALDPAANVVPQVFDPVSNDEVNFMRDSEWSWAFHSSSLGNEYTPARANESFIFDSGIDAFSAHSAPIYLFAYMITNPYELVSKLFSLDSLLDMVYGPWALDQYYSYFFSDHPVLGYEAIITGFYDSPSIKVSYVLNAPFLRINTPSTSGVVNYSPVLITGSATDAGRGSNGIASVFVNGKRASGDTAVSGDQANWSALTGLKLGTNQVTIMATDGSKVNIGITTNTLTLIYSPEAVTLPDLVVDEQSTLSTDISTKDAELSALPLAHSLVVGPVGMTVGRSGSLSWQPTEAQGPSTNLVEIVVTDGAASTRKRFSVMVREVNTAPSLTVSPVQVVAEGAALDMLLTAADSDIPAQPLRFSLIAGPNGLAITPSGRVSWSPTQAQRSSTNLVMLSVTDGITTVSGEFRVALPATNPPAEQPRIAIRNTEQPGIIELQISGTAGIELILETSDLLGSWVEEKRMIGQGMSSPVRVPLPTIPGTAQRFWRAKNTVR